MQTLDLIPHTHVTRTDAYFCQGCLRPASSEDMMEMKELDYSRSGCHCLGQKLEVVLVDKALLAGLVIHKSAVEVQN